jgi:ABC-type transport system involved in multi-copper enzyme maturation permease subunit
VFVTTAFVAGAVLRDFEHGTAEMLFATPMTKAAYIGGRFLGAWTAALLIFVPVGLAIAVGGVMPWIEPERVGPFMPGAYASAFLLFVVPNLFFMSAAFFGLATVTRSMMGTYVGLVAFFVAYAIAGTMLGNLDNRQLGALMDPFGLAAFLTETRYWTTVERNTRLLPLAGTLLANRLLWMAMGLAILGGTYGTFRMGVAARRRRVRSVVAPPERAGPEPHVVVARPALRHDAAAVRTAFLSQTRLEVRRVLRSIAFPIIIALGVLNLVGASFSIDEMYGTAVYPVTHLMLQMVQSAYLLFVLIVLTFYAGELVWRDRQAGMSEVVDALPVPSRVLWGPKLVALMVVVFLVLAAGGLTAIGIQLFRGYTRFELPLYAKGLLLEVGVPFLQLAVLAVLVQVLTNQKFVGYLIMILFFVSTSVLGALDFDHYLYQYAFSPPAPYSDMNGYGHFVVKLFWFAVYWTFCAAAFVVLIHVFWVRGRDTALRTRLRLAMARLRGPARAALAVSLIGFVLSGAWIFYNTNILNTYESDDTRFDRLARYEREYQQYADLAQPRISAVYAEVDIDPERRNVAVRGRYTLVNRSSEPIPTLHVVIPRVVEVRSLEGIGTVEHEDADVGYRIFRLPEPLETGDSLTMRFDLGVVTRGFAIDDGAGQIVRNGTFINNYDLFPHIGYHDWLELGDPNERRRRDLPPVERMPKLTADPAARRNNYISRQADWIDFETVVSTTPDQIALAPGYLQREWTENGRRYFHYRMDAPILAFFSYLSADWEVTRDEWNGVAIEVYHHRDHTWNVARMIESVKASLTYFTDNFGPYQHRQVRIVEFPRYASFAQSFPNTIPYSESIGFIARLDDDEDKPIDYVFYVTAHEVAHQWWAHQVIGADMQGSTVMSETMSQYSALMVMEKEYGPELMRRFLRYELDQYLTGRGGELIEELPLLRVENQGYVHYRKGSLVTYRLRELVGEEPLNAALQRYVQRVGFQQPPWTTSLEFLDAVREAGPSEALLEDLFETITLWDVRAESATFTPRDDGTWAVRLVVAAHKLRATGEGEETEVPMHDVIEIGVFGDPIEGGPALGRPLLVERRLVTAADSVFELVVDAEPRRAGIDPFNKLIDRNPEDNVTRTVRAIR